MKSHPRACRRAGAFRSEEGDSLTIRNPNLKPWTAHNFDLSAEYYTDNGGVISGGVFLKDIADFFGNDVRLATAEDVGEFGLDSRYIGWNVNTTFNSGDARVTGMEFNVRQSLTPIGTWGRFFSVFANATKLRLEGNQGAAFQSFIPKVMNWGVTFTKNPSRKSTSSSSPVSHRSDTFTQSVITRRPQPTAARYARNGIDSHTRPRPSACIAM